ncbi:MAG TPA: Ig-like domain-containing protein, partial [Gemmataceae bacterium]|nr:Ig-like domain-containing protein [Gemmataceae bacterium]
TFAGGLTATGPPLTTLNNTVVAQNQTTSPLNSDVEGNFVGGSSSNFIGTRGIPMSGIMNGTNGNIVGNIGAPADPRLGPLQFNGGPTLTRLPLPDSLLIDAGFNPAVPAGVTTDQRGLNRVVDNTVDIGATEFQFPVSAVVLTSSANPAALGDSVTFTATVSGVAPGSNTPTGAVTFSAGGTTLGTSDLAGGVAVFTTAALPAGTTDVTASYGGDSTFSASAATLAQQITPPPPPVQTVGVVNPVTATWYLRGSNSAGPPDAGQFTYGGAGWAPVVGDWGGGAEGIGTFDPSTATWYLRDEANAGAADAGQFRYGAAGWVAVSGDWNNSGHTGIGVFDPSTATWYLRGEADAGAPDAGQFRYGGAGWQPLVGDWTGSGHLGVGVFDPSTGTFYLRNTLGPGAPDFVFRFGGASARAVAGDWTGRGRTGGGVFDPVTATFYLRNTPSAGVPDFQFVYGGQSFTPVVGDFDFPVLPPRAAGGARRTDALDAVFADGGALS